MAFSRDELDYMACGEHLAWGYVDQPPLIVLWRGWLGACLACPLFRARLFPILAGAAVVWLTGILARELGGGRLDSFLRRRRFSWRPLYLAFDSFLSMKKLFRAALLAALRLDCRSHREGFVSTSVAGIWPGRGNCARKQTLDARLRLRAHGRLGPRG